MGIGRGALAIGSLGTLVIAKVKTDEPESVPHLAIASAAAHSFFEARRRGLQLSPSRRAHPALAGPVRRRWRNARSLVVRLESLVVLMGELEGMTELEVRRRISRRKPSPKLFDFDTRLRQVPGEPKQADKQSPRRNVLGMAVKPLPQGQDCLRILMAARQSLSPFGRACPGAGCAQERSGHDTKHGMPPRKHPEGFRA
jgi:hypothetical protein